MTNPVATSAASAPPMGGQRAQAHGTTLRQRGDDEVTIVYQARGRKQHQREPVHGKA